MGTVFEVHLPAAHKPLPPDVRADDAAGPDGMVLLVDDDEMILKTGRRLLESLGYKVFAARDGQAAIGVFRKYGSEIGIVLLDLMMPGMTGDEVFGELKKIDPAVNVAIVSGFADESLVQELMRGGCRGFLRKPYNAGDLSRFLREHMREKKGVIH
jgi:FixJ family two-component response regulator